jgi:hypothetical protein
MKKEKERKLLHILSGVLIISFSFLFITSFCGYSLAADIKEGLITKFESPQRVESLSADTFRVGVDDITSIYAKSLIFTHYYTGTETGTITIAPSAGKSLRILKAAFVNLGVGQNSIISWNSGPAEDNAIWVFADNDEAITVEVIELYEKGAADAKLYLKCPAKLFFKIWYWEE